MDAGAVRVHFAPGRPERSPRKPRQLALENREAGGGYKVDRTGKLAQHSKAPCSVPEINDLVAQQEFTSLLREICAPGTPATEGAAVRDPTGRAARRAAEASHTVDNFEFSVV